MKTWPTLIVCAAANVSDPGATPPGRGVASFTFSPAAIGGPLTGASHTADYESPAAMATGRNLRHRPRPQYLWKELFGRNRLEDKFLYVTDGGHYENLGLVELLRRGCRRIYCFDAGGGTTSRALGDAIALARTELDVEVSMELEEALQLVEDPTTHRAARAVARGRIRFPERD